MNEKQKIRRQRIARGAIPCHKISTALLIAWFILTVLVVVLFVLDSLGIPRGLDFIKSTNLFALVTIMVCWLISHIAILLHGAKSIQKPKGACAASLKDLESDIEGSALFLSCGGWSGRNGSVFTDIYYVYPVRLNYDFELLEGASYHMEKDPQTGKSKMAYSEPETFRITKITGSHYTIELSRELSANGSLSGWSNSHTLPIGTAVALSAPGTDAKLSAPSTDAKPAYTFKLRIVAADAALIQAQHLHHQQDG